MEAQYLKESLASNDTSKMSQKYVDTVSTRGHSLVDFYLTWDRLYLEACIGIVKLCIACQAVPILGEILRRITLMSGSFDTNAMLCLFLRYMYTFMPEPLTFDPMERRFAKIFLEQQYFMFAWMARTFSLRLLPPLIRPLYRSYYGRAVHASDFINRSIQERNVDQIVIMGAGYDATAYRTRHLRVTEDRSVKVFEVDLPRVQQRKLEIMRKAMPADEFAYFTEQVYYVECDFGRDSLLKVLQQSGYDTTKATAILWEGVTYYLPRPALEATLKELHELATLHKKVRVTTELELASVVESPTQVCDNPTLSSPLFSTPSDSLDTVSPDATTASSDESSRKGSDLFAATIDNRVWLFLDYMQEHEGTLDKAYKSQDKLWQLNTAQAEALGTGFITGFVDVEAELGKFGLKAIEHITFSKIESTFFTRVPASMSVFVEENTTFGHNEPHLNLVECLYD